MTETRHLTFYLHSSLRQRAKKGRHNFINKISEVVQQSGWTVGFKPQDDASLIASTTQPGYAMFHMDDPFHDRALTMRRVYEYPFWAIEETAKRWEWSVAHRSFCRPGADQQEIDRFFHFWRKRLFGAAADQPRKEGFVYVPLQGRLLHHRSFQSCSPLEMLTRVLEQDRARKVIATLHPNETYDASELAALEELKAQHPRLHLQTGHMARLLAGCDYVVTQNSSAAFFGYFFQKPAVLFGQVDFHHIACNVHRMGVAGALAQVHDHRPDYAAYLYWFWQEQSINAGLDGVKNKIRSRLLAAGWPL